jgi:hypothetical protein
MTRMVAAMICWSEVSRGRGLMNQVAIDQE